MLVRDLIKDVYQKLGNLSLEQLPLEFVLPHLYSVVDRRLIQMGYSETNLTLKSAVRTYGEQDNALGVSDFGYVAHVEYRIAGTERWSQIDTVNFTELDSAYDNGLRKCAIYGMSPARIRFSFVPDSSFEVQVWYQPAARQSKGAAEAVNVPSHYQNMLSDEIVLSVIPFAINDGNERRLRMLADSIGQRYGDFNRAWEREIVAARINRGVVRKRPFRAGY